MAAPSVQTVFQASGRARLSGVAPVRIVLVGNSFASAVQLPALAIAGGNEVVGLAGADRAKAERIAREHAIPRASDDYRALLELEPDLVIVTTPVHLHREMVLDVLERTGAAILCEKPFALDAGEAQEMCERAQGRGAWIDHQLRWSPLRRTIRERIAAGDLGEVRHVEMDYSIAAPGFAAREYRWWYDAARGGGILGALGSHMIDLLRSELGEVARVRAQLDVVIPERPDADGVLQRVTADEHATFALGFASGARADLTTSLATSHARGFYTRYTGSTATLVLENEERLLHAPHGEEVREVVIEPGLPTAAQLGMPDRGPFSRALPAYLADVVAAVRDGRTELAGAAHFSDGLAVQRVLDAARRSHASGGGWVEVSG